ncbi:MAG: hypothetical protein AAGC84_09340, partial [Pseudomonas sp.]
LRTAPCKCPYNPAQRLRQMRKMYYEHNRIISCPQEMYIEHLWHLSMSEGITDRGMRLLAKASLKDLAEAGSTEYVRWQNIKRGRARIGADEIEILGRVFPHYRWWLITGDALPEIGQTDPDLETNNQ